ncbi:MAG: DUF1905 domain-containing protein [Phycisphaerales bacterium]|nr:DUF1905 domain-containing protein [Phycisphaerales bacterium]
MKRFSTRIKQDDGSAGCGIELPFDPKEAFGKVRAPVVATFNGYSYRTTVCAMEGSYWIPLARKHREGAKVEAGQKVTVTLELDDKPRVVEVPKDLALALAKDRKARDAWNALSYTHQREHAEAITGAKKPETRARRVAKALEMLRDH